MNTEYEQNENVKYLKEDSILFSSLLYGDEIRYTDLIKYFIEEAKYNPFTKKVHSPKNESIYREKLYMDILISNICHKKYGKYKNDKYKKEKEFDIPNMLIENKFKSLPNDKQLIKYSKKFVEKYLEAFKIQKKNENNNFKLGDQLNEEDFSEFQTSIKNLHFLLLLPFFNGDETKPIILDNITENGNEREIYVECIWKYFDYKSLGGNILNFLPDEKKSYQELFFEDFGNTLIHISALMREFIPIQLENVSIVETFNSPKEFIELKLQDLYAKYRASQCAELLSKRFSDGAPIYQWKYNDFENNEVVIVNHSFSNGTSLFEVARKITDNVIYIIQYQAKQLRKGLVVKDGKIAVNNKQWFLCENKEWKANEIKLNFDIKDKNESQDAIKMYNKFSGKDGFTFYYSFCKLSDGKKEEKTNNSNNRNLLVKDVIELMIGNIISDSPCINKN